MKEKENSLFLPLLIIRGLVLFPYSLSVIDVGRKKSILAIKEAIKKNNGNMIFVTQKDSLIEDPKQQDIFSTGVFGCAQILSETNGELKISISSSSRIKIKNINVEQEGFLSASYTINDGKITDLNDTFHLIEIIMSFLSDNIIWKRFDTKKLEQVKNIYEEKDFKQKTATELAKFIYMLVDSIIVSPIDDKETLLEENDLNQILSAIAIEFSKDKVGKELDNKINKKVNENLANQQKEFFLRERLKTIKEELGDTKSRDNDATELRKKVNDNPYPKLIKNRLLDEINRYEAMPPASQEGNLVRTYIDWLMALPWWQSTEDNSDINKVKKILDQNHYGLTKVKERIIEYLAVKTKSNSLKAPILCLVGPPGVGKTSLAFSIAESLGRKFVKVSLGGVKDESEIRGHRKTYLGSMPGRIIQGMKRAGVINPLFLLDEIDKMSSDYRGDPSSAMLEVLDPEQNKIFSDNYIEEEYDLSQVMFVATANYHEQIPEVLIDRMELIELSSYTAIEKLEIAKTHLIPKIIKETNLKENEISFNDESILYIINYYTCEAGVRDLERKLQTIVRKYVVQSLKVHKVGINVDVKVVKKLLGKEIYELTMKDDDAIAGIVNGMAYTTAGGSLLPIEVSLFPGKGNIITTGNLKETMKESASVALGYVRANAERFSIKNDIFLNNDFHIHVPQGGVPKDGPSAGVALTTAIISAITKTKISPKISMTGEITLRGKVLIIGGIKEKVISAHRAGVRTMFIPKSDERFLEDVPKEILQDLDINLIDNYNEIYAKLFFDKI